MQEKAFEFDPVFKDYDLANPLVKKHPEYDQDAMLHHALTPALYNRCVALTL